MLCNVMSCILSATYIRICTWNICKNNTIMHAHICMYVYYVCILSSQFYSEISESEVWMGEQEMYLTIEDTGNVSIIYCMHITLQIKVHKYVRVYIYAFMYVPMYMHTVYICMYTCIHAYVCA